MTKFSIGDLFYILFLSSVIASLMYLWYIIANYEPSKTKIVSTLVCSGKVIVFDQDFLYMAKGVSWRFPHGSYTPSQGEVCTVQGREVSK